MSQYLYGSEPTELSIYTVTGVLYAAEKYCLDGLKNHCLQFVDAHIADDDSSKVLARAAEQGFDQVSSQTEYRILRKQHFCRTIVRSYHTSIQYTLEYQHLYIGVQPRTSPRVVLTLIWTLVAKSSMLGHAITEMQQVVWLHLRPFEIHVRRLNVCACDSALCLQRFYGQNVFHASALRIQIDALPSSGSHVRVDRIRCVRLSSRKLWTRAKLSTSFVYFDCINVVFPGMAHIRECGRGKAMAVALSIPLFTANVSTRIFWIRIEHPVSDGARSSQHCRTVLLVCLIVDGHGFVEKVASHTPKIH